MTENIDNILDECLDRISRGETPGRCLARFPSVAEELRPLLEIAAELDTCNFQPAFERRAAARRRFMKAAFKPKRSATQFFSFWASWRGRTMASVVAVIVIALVSAFMLRPVFIGNGSSSDLGPPATAVVSTVVPDTSGNFILLVSDAPNAIGDFRSLTMTISKVYLQSKGTGSDGWFEFEPVLPTVDLTQLQGDAFQEVWRGSVPPGDYQKVVIYTTDVTGVLVSGQQQTVKLPSDKLQVSVPFSIGTDSPVSFTFDVTVFATGNSGKYILTPQADQSGAVSGKAAEVDKTNNGKSDDNSKNGNSDNAASNNGNANNDNAKNANTTPGNANNDKTKTTREPNN
jgi:hypothetical protein